MDQFFRGPVVRPRITSNPIGSTLWRYVDYLESRGHRVRVVKQYVNAAEHFGCWLDHRKILYRTVDQFIKVHLPQCRCSPPAVRNLNCVRAALGQLLQMLGIKLVVRADKSAMAQLVRDYDSHLERVCGLSRSTIWGRLHYARQLVCELKIRRRWEFRRLSSREVAEFVSASGQRWKPNTRKGIATGTRSFLRFLLLQGHIKQDLAAAVPSFSNWQLATLPRTVERDKLEKLLATVKPQTPIDLRDRAILLCLMELGLRVSDAAAIEIDGLDFAAGILRLKRPKQRNQIELPIPDRLSKALQEYLQSGRPACQTRRLFVKHRAPVGELLASDGVRDVVSRRVAAAGFGDHIRGSHVFRHSVATTLINSGATIKQIADLLGHRSINTTAIYSKVDLTALSRVALPWPSKGVKS